MRIVIFGANGGIGRWTVVRFMEPKDLDPSGKVEVSFGEKKFRFNIARADSSAFMVA